METEPLTESELEAADGGIAKRAVAEIRYLRARLAAAEKALANTKSLLDARTAQVAMESSALANALGGRDEAEARVRELEVDGWDAVIVRRVLALASGIVRDFYAGESPHPTSAQIVLLCKLVCNLGAPAVAGDPGLTDAERIAAWLEHAARSEPVAQRIVAGIRANEWRTYGVRRTVPADAGEER
jgi:hypothetical protein